jgi:hypothetical protein
MKIVERSSSIPSERLKILFRHFLSDGLFWLVEEVENGTMSRKNKVIRPRREKAVLNGLIPDTPFPRL